MAKRRKALSVTGTQISKFAVLNLVLPYFYVFYFLGALILLEAVSDNSLDLKLQ